MNNKTVITVLITEDGVEKQIEIERKNFDSTNEYLKAVINTIAIICKDSVIIEVKEVY